MTLIRMIGTIGRCIHNNHPIEYLRSLERSIPKGKFSIKATPPIRSNARLIIIVLNKIIYFMAKSQAKAVPRSRNCPIHWAVVARFIGLPGDTGSGLAIKHIIIWICGTPGAGCCNHRIMLTELSPRIFNP